MYDIKKIQSAYASVPVKLNDNKAELDTLMVAGSVGTRISHGALKAADGKSGLNPVQPVSCWWMVEEVGGDKEADQEEDYF